MAFITVEGEQLIAQKQGANEVLYITHFVLANIAGLGAEPEDRIAVMPDVADIVDEQPVTWQGYVNANQVVYSLTLDSSIGDYAFNWVGLKAGNGELMAVTHIDPPQEKIKTAGAVPGNNLTRNFLLAYSGIQATTAIEVPAETWQIDFTDRVWEIDERQRFSNLDTYGKSAFFCDGFKVSAVAGNTVSIDAGVGYVGGIRVVNLAPYSMDVIAPKSVWVDASLQGDINGVAARVVVSASSVALTDYTDALGFDHYVAKIADIPSQGVVLDMRPIAPVFLRRDDIVPEAEAKAGTSTTPRAWTAQRVKQAINNSIPTASETLQGKVELATAAETAAGTDNTRAVHPAGLKARIDAVLAQLKGYWLEYYRVEKTSYQDVVSSSWVDVAGLSLSIVVTKGPVTAKLFSRVSAHFKAANKPAFCRMLINGGEYGNFVADNAIAEGVGTYSMGQSFVLERNINLAQNTTYTIKIQIRNSTESPGQNVRINASEESPTSATPGALCILTADVFKA